MTDGTDAAEGTPQQNAQTQQDSAAIGIERQGEL